MSLSRKSPGREIGKSDKESFEAEIAKEAANVDAQSAKIEELAGDIAFDEADLKAATHIHEKEETDFQAKEKDLVRLWNTGACCWYY